MTNPRDPLHIPTSPFHPIELDGHVKAERFRTGAQRFRFFPMVGDSMEPALRSGDLLAVVPADRYDGEGLYVLDLGFGPSIWRCSHVAYSDPHLIECRYDNPAYQKHVLPMTKFDDAVLAKGFATVKIIDHHPLEQGDGQ